MSSATMLSMAAVLLRFTFSAVARLSRKLPVTRSSSTCSWANTGCVAPEIAAHTPSVNNFCLKFLCFMVDTSLIIFLRYRPGFSHLLQRILRVAPSPQRLGQLVRRCCVISLLRVCNLSRLYLENLKIPSGGQPGKGAGKIGEYPAGARLRCRAFAVMQTAG